MVLKQIARTGGAVPEEMQGGPELQIGAGLYWRAFWDLCSCRDVEVPIPWVHTQKWVEVYELNEDQRETLHHVIRDMDRVFLAHINSQIKKQREAEASKTKKDPANADRVLPGRR